jgi:hypothetical protein
MSSPEKAWGHIDTDAHGAENTPRCPFCHSTDVEPLALIGAQLSTAQYYCRACHTPFEYMRREPDEPARR